jgi:hypothetical protein
MPYNNGNDAKSELFASLFLSLSYTVNSVDYALLAEVILAVGAR